MNGNQDLIAAIKPHTSVDSPASNCFAGNTAHRSLHLTRFPRPRAWAVVAVEEARSAMGRVSRTHRRSTMVRNCTRDEGGPFEAGSQVQVSSHRKLLSSRRWW